jgi:hypothetical protein
MPEPQYRHYWRVLYPEYVGPKSTAHWYRKWKTAEMWRLWSVHGPWLMLTNASTMMTTMAIKATPPAMPGHSAPG